jgi:hypothetical protein
MKRRIASIEKHAVVTTGELTAFMAGLERYRSVIKTERLQIRHGRREEPTYTQLINDDFWFVLETKEGVKLSYLSQWTVFETGRGCMESAMDILDARIAGKNLLDTVWTIIRGDAANPAWVSDQLSSYDAQYCNTAGLDVVSLLPQILVDLPNVEDYCQSDVYGPLALTAFTLKCSTPPKIFTHHPRPIMPMCFCVRTMVPIIIGSINRYYLGAPSLRDKSGTSKQYEVL